MKKITISLLFLLLIVQFSFSQQREPFFMQEELIFPTQDLHSHGSSIVELPNGDLLSTWFMGTGERNSDDVRIMGARKKKGATRWTSPFVMADTEGLPDCNPVLFLNSKGKLFLVWIVVQANEWHGSILVSKTSSNYNTDDAPVWEWQSPIFLKPDNRFAEEVEIGFKAVKGPNNGWSEYAQPYDKMILAASKEPMKRSFGWMTRIKPLVYPNGRILLPLYSDGFNMGLMAVSDNDGETWMPSLPLVGRGPIQPALALCKNGDILAYSRDSGDAPTRVWESRSSDKGATWSSATKTEIPCEASVELHTLKDGRMAMVVNDSPEGGRSLLSLYISTDEGKTWPFKTALENDTQDKGGYSYPSLIQGKDGMIHITYSYNKKSNKSIKHLVIDPTKITVKK